MVDGGRWKAYGPVLSGQQSILGECQDDSANKAQKTSRDNKSDIAFLSIVASCLDSCVVFDATWRVTAPSVFYQT